MKAAILTEEGFVLEEVTRPIPGPGQVLIKTYACGVCSGDLHVYLNRNDYIGFYNRLGHEGVGRIAEVGSGIDEFSQGDWVASLSLPAYSEYYLAEIGEIAKVPPMDDYQLCLGEALACCVHAADRFRIPTNAKVAVVGCGFMGLVCLQLAKLQGAGFICAIDRFEERRNWAESYGANVAYDYTVRTTESIVEEHGPFDLVIEAAGSQSALDACTLLVANHGMISIIGYHQSSGGKRTVDMERWNFKAIDVVNGHVRRQDEKLAAMVKALELLADGSISVKELVTCYSFEELEQAFRDLEAGKAGLCKAVVTMKEG